MKLARLSGKATNNEQNCRSYGGIPQAAALKKLGAQIMTQAITPISLHSEIEKITKSFIEQLRALAEITEIVTHSNLADNNTISLLYGIMNALYEEFAKLEKRLANIDKLLLKIKETNYEN